MNIWCYCLLYHFAALQNREKEKCFSLDRRRAVLQFWARECFPLVEFIKMIWSVNNGNMNTKTIKTMWGHRNFMAYARECSYESEPRCKGIKKNERKIFKQFSIQTTQMPSISTKIHWIKIFVHKILTRFEYWRIFPFPAVIDEICSKN